MVWQESQVGLRIRESFAVDFETPDSYRESYGLLDVTISSGSEGVLMAAVCFPTFFLPSSLLVD